jgi:predicted TIM-barrel fold metal-dependent hydrolase
LLVLLHNDIDAPFAKEGEPPVYWDQLLALFRKHPRTTLVWAHLGVGRVVHPVGRHVALLNTILEDPQLRHVHFDISWSELAKYVVATEETSTRVARLINQFPDRFLFGTDEVAPEKQEHYLRVYEQYAPMLGKLTPEAREKLLKGNFERLFDQAKQKVRAWERAHSTGTRASVRK